MKDSQQANIRLTHHDEKLSPDFLYQGVPKMDIEFIINYIIF